MPVLNWIGKDAVVNHDKQVPFRLLKKVKSASHGSKSENLIIHGDNLEALKALMPYYQGKVKCIYIDPPYNTGNEKWVYNDKVNSPKIKQWLGKVVGKDSEDLTRHDKWLCMMYPRLKLLRELLCNDGLIMISVDDNEYHHLKSICDEIFGENNFFVSFVWNTDGHTDNQYMIKVNHEYILTYIKDYKYTNSAVGYVVDPNTREESNLWRGYAENSITKNGPANPPSEVELPIGFPCKVETLALEKTQIDNAFFVEVKETKFISRQITKKYKVQYPVRLDEMTVSEHKLTKTCRVFTGWANVKKLKKFIENDCQPIPEGEDEISFFLSDRGVIYYNKKRKGARNILSVLKNFGTTEQMKYDLEKIEVNFDYPKPNDLIKYLIKIASKKDSIVLDSFAGSGTTAQSVIELNDEEDGSCRKFILVEMEDYAKSVTSKRVARILDSKKNEGGFEYCELSKPLFDADGKIDESCDFKQLASYVYFTETQTNLDAKGVKDNYIGEHNTSDYYLIYRGKGKNDLNEAFLKKLKCDDRAKVIYADRCLLDDEVLKQYGIVFKQIPYEVKIY